MQERGKGAEVFFVSPFKRLARAHGFGVGGDALIAIALADSLFFSIDPNDARWKVALYLMLTIAPFGLIAPFLGPAMDRLRGGHGLMIVIVGVVRAILALGMVRFSETLWLFPLAFALLVMGKAHHVAKSAVVPTLVDSADGLVKANSQLSIVSAISGGLAGIPGVLLLRFGGGGPSVLALAVAMFAASAFLALKIPKTVVAENPADEEEIAELRSTGVILAASTMAYVRAVAGFLTMLLAFSLRGGVDPGPDGVGVEIAHRVREAMSFERLDLATGGAPPWHFGVVLVAMGIGGLSGAFASPRLRKVVSEERILAGVLGAVAVLGILGAISSDLLGAMIVGFVVSLAGSAGKQSFDAIVQRDAPEANLGRSFGRFESRFQLAWVFGAIIPVVIPIPARIGFLMLAIPAGFAGASYWYGRSPVIKADKARKGVENVRERATRARTQRQQTGVDTSGMTPTNTEMTATETVGPKTMKMDAVGNFEPTQQVDSIDLKWADDPTKPISIEQPAVEQPEVQPPAHSNVEPPVAKTPPKIEPPKRPGAT